MEFSTKTISYWTEMVKLGKVLFDPFQNESSQYDWCPICPMCGEFTPIKEAGYEMGEWHEDSYPCHNCRNEYVADVYPLISEIYRNEYPK